MTKFRISLAIAVFFAMASTAAAATLTASPSTVGPGGTVTVSWSDVTNPARLDWIGKYFEGAPDAAYEDDFVYTSSCSQTPGASGVASGSCTFTMPTTLGTYEFRLFENNGSNLLARSGPVQVSTAPPPIATLTASPSTVSPGGTVTVTWSGIPNPNRSDWIGGYVPSASDAAYNNNWVYTSSCSQTAGASGPASGSCSFTVPTTPGTIEFRLFASTGSKLATSGIVQVSTPPPTPALTASPSAVSPGGSVTVTWSGVPNPNVSDRIGRFVPGAPDGSFDTFVYTSSCSQTAGANPAASGSCTFTMPATPGTYEFRLFASTGTKLATSGIVQVSTTPPPSGGGARIVSYTTSTTLTADDVNRSIINNSGANAPITLTLPAAAVGNVVSVYVVAGQPITINPNGTERIQILTNANGDAIQSDSVRGTTITLVCQIPGSWEPMGQIGAWFDVN